jgi:hypothetical protein
MTATARRRCMRRGSAASVVSLSELDRRIIGLVSDQRVVTSTQLETLSALAVWRQWIDYAGGDPAKSLPSKSSWPTTATPCDKPAAAFRGHGGQARRPSSGRKPGVTQTAPRPVEPRV